MGYVALYSQREWSSFGRHRRILCG